MADGSQWIDFSRRVAGAASRRTALRTFAAGAALATIGPDIARGQGGTSVPDPGDWSTVESLVLDAEETGGVVGVAVFGQHGEVFARHGEALAIAGIVPGQEAAPGA